MGAFSSKALVSSKTGDWNTPIDFFKAMEKLFGAFDLDAAAKEENALCPYFIDPEIDALSVPWDGERIWLNPPYGRDMEKWMRKAANEALCGDRERTIVCLVHARTDTRWWHAQVMGKASAVYFVKGRLRFSKCNNVAPFPSAVILYNRNRIMGIPFALYTLSRQGEILFDFSLDRYLAEV